MAQSNWVASQFYRGGGRNLPVEAAAVAKDNGFTLRLDPAVAVYISDGGGQF